MGITMIVSVSLARGSGTSSQKRNWLQKKSLADQSAVLLIRTLFSNSVKKWYALV